MEYQNIKSFFYEKYVALVTVEVDGKKIISTEHGIIRQELEMGPDYNDEIPECAKHLLGFIGELNNLWNCLVCGYQNAGTICTHCRNHQHKIVVLLGDNMIQKKFTSITAWLDQSI